MRKDYQSIEQLTNGLLEELQIKCYGKETLNNYRRILKKLILYMQLNEISSYSSEIGRAFIEDYISTHEISVSFQKTISSVTKRLSDYCDGRAYSLQRKKSSVKLPENHAVFLEDYLSFCKQSGNRSKTINCKRKFCGDFLVSLLSLRCNDIRDVNSTQISKACLMFHNKDAWAVIRMFLKYLYKETVIEYDYSTIVPPIIKDHLWSLSHIRKMKFLGSRTL
ncbi:hypothetical protein JCM21714_2185 [Gracilibacillus boraciitolerans JCM 21714]|uniref:Core-binding (CB) domain-containing protein n=1 Tax=Gracilibacillus boraciitolerans JCM 21714 TaxID=1298598 RepID=W4VIV4_9BACI|nr:hypothetical protein [Gracilibacillus boraciitolerans]GAE93142.1 hypothetical protein JCM21714_2185 [Gracilibacillus boraciitolerans JCM 21714]